ncbi:MAG: T9SS type A sorting domain-containing protein [Flavobacteriales bacterium]|nr:T9SS type A sorting domain-containing protein [Flavobacteriales bacterium]
MKRIILLLSMLSFGIAQAQNCTSCTVTISTLDATPQVVTTGMTLCIASGGELSGDIVISGGIVCIEGTLSSTNIAMTGGTIENYGVIFSEKLGMSGGEINNYANASVSIDSVGINSNGAITNEGQWNSNDMGLSKSVVGTSQPVWNNIGSASLTVDSLGVDDWTMNLEGSFVVNYAMGVTNGAVINNNGLFDVWGDLGNSATINNHDQMTVGRDLGNSGTLHNTCTIYVMRHFASSGTCTGPTASCASIAVDSSSANSGDFGADGSNLDFCDNAAGFDGNVGTIGPNVTYCSCNSTCNNASAISSAEYQNELTVFPNPFSSSTVFTMKEEGAYSLSIYDVKGQLMKTEKFKGNRIEISSHELVDGVYFYQIRGTNDYTNVGKLVVVM